MSLRRVLIFFSDTGGGHRAAANALTEAFHFQFPERYEIVMVDGFAECAPFPLSKISATYYPLTTYTPQLWGGLFHSSNTPLTLPTSAAMDDVLLRRGCARALRQHQPDLVISVHPLINRAPCNALKNINPYIPFATVVTDLFDAHGMWFSAASDLVIVPTQGAFNCGVRWGFPPSRMRVVGQPIALKFVAPAPHETPEVLRARLGLQPEILTLLLVGGGKAWVRCAPLRARWMQPSCRFNSPSLPGAMKNCARSWNKTHGACRSTFRALSATCPIGCARAMW